MAKSVTYYARDPEKDFFMEKGHVGFSTFGEQVNVDIMAMALSGGTGPVTLAGTIVQTIAEHLSGLVLAQTIKKGSIVTFGSCSTIMDLKTGLTSVGAPEWSMVGTAIAKMSQYYGIPCRIGAGVSDSKVPDAYAG
ncbi:MAG: trimethylamine methyltransferase family protein [Proteobacteria bacterium]|nr:trimethylamine methyltransferase family protein [Pseudomonadota bacterium]